MAICCNEPIAASPSAAPLFSAAVNFPSGQLSAIIGPSGAGKSSLIRHLAQLDKSHSNVTWFGQLAAAQNLKSRAKTRAFLPQSNELALNFSALDIVKLAQNDGELVQKALEYCHANHLAQRHYQSLSGGERQRVLLARAIAQLLPSFSEKLLLLDEPVSALDIGLQHQLYAMLKEFCTNGLTIVVVEHDLHLAKQYPDYFGIVSTNNGATRYTETDTLTASIVADTYNVPTALAAEYF